MRYGARIDKNQPAIVAALRAAGCSVTPLHAVGAGCPDLLVGKLNRNFLLEVKDATGRHYTKGQCLTPAQEKYHFLWQGQVDIVWTPEEAVSVVNWLLEGA